MSDFNRMVMTQNGLVDVDYYVEQARRERAEMLAKAVKSLFNGIARMLKPRRPLAGASALVH
ncbi:MAG: RSP_7527 family protein [Marinobacterium sp.]